MGKENLQGDKENAREWQTELLSPTYSRIKELRKLKVLKILQILKEWG